MCQPGGNMRLCEREQIFTLSSANEPDCAVGLSFFLPLSSVWKCPLLQVCRTGCMHRRAASSSKWLLRETKCEVICCDQNRGRTGNSLDWREEAERSGGRAARGSGWRDESRGSFLLLLCIGLPFVLPRFYIFHSSPPCTSQDLQFHTLTSDQNSTHSLWREGEKVQAQLWSKEQDLLDLDFRIRMQMQTQPG